MNGIYPTAEDVQQTQGVVANLQKDSKQLFTDCQTFVQERPVKTMIGVLALGLLIGRLLR